MKKIREQEFIQKYNQAYGRAIGAERKKRKLTLEKLSAGIMSRTMLDKVEKGIVQWTNVEGDTLMLRMGIPPEYFGCSGRIFACWCRDSRKKLLPQ